MDDIHLTGLTAPQSKPRSTSSQAYREVSLDVLEREYILETLKRTNWNKSKAAQILGIERSTLDRKLKRYEVSRPR